MVEHLPRRIIVLELSFIIKDVSSCFLHIFLFLRIVFCRLIMSQVISEQAPVLAMEEMLREI